MNNVSSEGKAEYEKALPHAFTTLLNVSLNIRSLPSRSVFIVRRSLILAREAFLILRAEIVHSHCRRLMCSRSQPLCLVQLTMRPSGFRVAVLWLTGWE